LQYSGWKNHFRLQSCALPGHHYILKLFEFKKAFIIYFSIYAEELSPCHSGISNTVHAPVLAVLTMYSCFYWIAVLLLVGGVIKE
jgi:hypothetical protein